MRRNPQTRIDLEVVDFGSELFLYDKGNDAVHILNTTAREILQLCDGEHDTEDIAAEIGRQFPGVDPEQLLRDVERAVEALVDKHVLVWTTAHDAAERAGPVAAGS